MEASLQRTTKNSLAEDETEQEYEEQRQRKPLRPEKPFHRTKRKRYAARTESQANQN